MANRFVLTMPWLDINWQPLAMPAWQAESGVPVADLPAAPQVSGQAPARTIRYLQHAAVPFTRRASQNVLQLPEAELVQNVRTSVMVYQVQAGDSVLSIAQQFGLDGNSILWANPKIADNPDFLSIDQEVKILPIDGALHSVSASETVDTVAKRYKVAPDVIWNYVGNHLTQGQALEAGQELIIPGGIKPYVARQVFAYSGAVPQNASKGSGSFVWPTSGFISQGYWAGHHAIDIAGSPGVAVKAADSGYVAVAQWSDVGYGRMVIIDHGNGYQTLYAHMNAYYVEVGQSVSKGQSIGERGSTGNSTGPHLHFEVIKNGVCQNPFIYLP